MGMAIVSGVATAFIVAAFEGPGWAVIGFGLVTYWAVVSRSSVEIK